MRPPKISFLRPHPDPDEKVLQLHCQMEPILEHDEPNPRLVKVVRSMRLVARGTRLPIRVVAYVNLPRPRDWSDADVEALEEAAFDQLWIERMIWK